MEYIHTPIELHGNWVREFVRVSEISVIMEIKRNSSEKCM
jgi:hypothetical protein